MSALLPCVCGPHSPCPATCERRGSTIIGIDPGIQGAVAWVSPAGHLIEVADLPVQKIKGRSVLMPAVLAAMLAKRPPAHAYLEKVGTRPGEGAVGAFSFGRGVGMIEGVLAALGVPMTPVTPNEWKREQRLTADKGAARARAAQLWPGLAGQFMRVKDDGRAEAALIARHGANSIGRKAA